jgi:hypothetical protein
MTEVKSPCMNICGLDENDMCFGCYRTLNEITHWHNYSNEEKIIVLGKANKRAQGEEDA